LFSFEEWAENSVKDLSGLENNVMVKGDIEQKVVTTLERHTYRRPYGAGFYSVYS
jgi:hypothetical protein